MVAINQFDTTSPHSLLRHSPFVELTTPQSTFSITIAGKADYGGARGGGGRGGNGHCCFGGGTTTIMLQCVAALVLGPEGSIVVVDGVLAPTVHGPRQWRGGPGSAG
jgi:hypothetical protein